MSGVYWHISDSFSFLICFNECQAELACKITLEKAILFFRYRMGKFLLSAISLNTNEIHGNQHMLRHDVCWLRGCSSGMWCRLLRILVFISPVSTLTKVL